MNFTDGVKIPVEGLLDDHDGLCYLPWAKAIALSQRPRQKVVTFDQAPYLSFFGGAVVAIDMQDNLSPNRVWLPVLNELHQPIPEEELTPRDVHDAISRCKTKAIAFNTGVGMSVYAGFGDQIKSFLNQLGIKPDTNLEHAGVPFKTLGQSPYVEWSIAYTAAKITDPNFTFEVEMFSGPDGMMPAVKVGSGYSVAVSVCYKSEKHTEWLPIIDRNGVSIESPTVFDWNTSVMRALTKAIAIVSGYGLGIYAKEDLNNLLGRKPIEKKGDRLEKPPATSDEDNPVTEMEMAILRERLEQSGTDESEVLDFLGSDSIYLDGIPRQLFKQVESVLNAKPQ